MNSYFDSVKNFFYFFAISATVNIVGNTSLYICMINSPEFDDLPMIGLLKMLIYVNHIAFQKGCIGLPCLPTPSF